MKTCILFLALCAATHLNAQQEHVADFDATETGDRVQFSTIRMSPLRQISGAPSPYWSYYWEFGDGDFSFAARPTHRYAASGTYSALLYATNIYDDGIPPGRMIDTVFSGSGLGNTDSFSNVFSASFSAIALKTNRNPRAEEELVCIISYRNMHPTDTTTGRLHLFFNEKSAESPHFALAGARTHFGEVPAPALTTNSSLFLLNNSRNKYQDESVWNFPTLLPGKKRNVFITLKGTTFMLQDTNKTIHLQGVFVPANAALEAQEFTLSLNIARSHDPNDMSVSHTLVDCSSSYLPELEYLIRFQNDGDGAARRVDLDVELSKMLNAASLHLLEWYPNNDVHFTTRFTERGVHFTLDSIYLPGMRQVIERDSAQARPPIDTTKINPDPSSTQGFLRFSIQPKAGRPEAPVRTRTEITFDRDTAKALYTNYATTTFQACPPPPCCCCIPCASYTILDCKPGPSVGPKGGYAVSSGEFPGDYPFFGISISQRRSSKLYPQVELLFGAKGRTALPAEVTDSIKIMLGPHSVFPDSTIALNEQGGHQSFVSLELPVILRKDFSRSVGAGIGASANLFFEKGQEISTKHVITKVHDPFGSVITTIVPSVTTSTAFSKTRIRGNIFADLTLGNDCSGPVLGIRPGFVLNDGLKAFVQASLVLKF